MLLITGCNNNNEARNENGGDGNDVVQVRNNRGNEEDRKSSQQIAEHLVHLASEVPGVNDATAVVLGNMAVVGIDVKKDLERSDVDTIKYSVAESLKDDPNGANAIVVADADTMERLREINQDIQNGSPIRGIMNELSDIVGRVMPEVPADLEDPKPRDGIEDSKDKLNEKGEKKNLEQQQEKQSNYYKDQQP